MSALHVCLTCLPCVCIQTPGTIALSRTSCPRVSYAACAWLLLLGLVPKFGAALAAMPDCLYGGLTSVLSAAQVSVCVCAVCIASMCRTMFSVGVFRVYGGPHVGALGRAGQGPLCVVCIRKGEGSKAIGRVKSKKGGARLALPVVFTACLGAWPVVSGLRIMAQICSCICEQT